MMSAADNDLITRIAPGTPCGNLMRRYWQPAALVDELTGGRPVKPVRLLGENLVLFRDEQGWLNQAAAAVCDDVYFVTAGLPMCLKALRTTPVHTTTPPR